MVKAQIMQLSYYSWGLLDLLQQLDGGKWLIDRGPAICLPQPRAVPPVLWGKGRRDHVQNWKSLCCLGAWALGRLSVWEGNWTLREFGSIGYFVICASSWLVIYLQVLIQGTRFEFRTASCNQRSPFECQVRARHSQHDGRKTCLGKDTGVRAARASNGRVLTEHSRWHRCAWMQMRTKDAETCNWKEENQTGI